MTMNPRLARQLTPLIHEIGEYNFERLCNELLEHESGINKSDLYGKRGQKQRGIDLFASVSSGGIEVGQCKCEKSFSVTKVRKASEAFLKYLSYWKDRKVRRFILFVACETNDTNINDEELLQRDRFEEIGIAYEIWNASTICKKLRPHRTIARTYIDSEEVVNSICGPAVESAATQNGLTMMIQQLGVFSSELEELHGRELKSLREMSLGGDQEKALAGVEELQKKDSWPNHSPQFRARVVRFKAAVWLNLRRDLKNAERLVAEARKLDADGDFQTIDAYLAYCRSNIPAALELLKNPLSVEARNLRWAVLLESGRFDDLDKEFSEESDWPLNAESYRLKAMLALIHKDIAGARLALARASDVAPNRRNIRYVRAITDYYSAISPVADHLGRLTWPVPAAWSLVKRDAASVSALESAARVFLEDAQQSECPIQEKETLQIWNFACLSNIEGKQDKAATLAASLLSDFPANHGVISWALERGYEFDYAKCDEALRERIDQDPENIDLQLALWSLVFHTKDALEGEAVVDRAKQAFDRTGNQDVWLFHKQQFVALRGDVVEARRLTAKIADRRLRCSAENSLLRRGSRSSLKQRKSLAKQLKEDFDATGNARVLLECCDIKLGLGDYQYIADNASKLVEEVATASALRLALEGAWRSEEYGLFLDLIERHKNLFHEGKLSSDIRNLKNACLLKQGDWSESLRDAEAFYREQPNLQNFFAYFELLLESGDPRRCSDLARDLLSLKSVKPKHLLRVIGVVQMHDLGLAIDLWRRANRRPIKNLKLAASSVELAFRLGLSKEAEPLVARLTKKAVRGKGPFHLKTFDELTELIQKDREIGLKNSEFYLQGKVPIHLLAENIGRPLVSLYHHQLEYNRAESNLFRTPIIFARAGNRVVQHVKPKEIIMDVTAILLAADVGILDVVESNFKKILISQSITPSLMEQVGKVTPSQPERQAARVKFVQLIRAGEIRTVNKVDSITVVSNELAKRLSLEDLTLLETAKLESGYMLSNGVILDQSAEPVDINLLESASDLVRSRKDFESCLEGDPVVCADSLLPEGSVLLVPHSMVASFNAEELENAVRQFKLTVTAETLRILEGEIEEYSKAANLAKWTHSVLDRVQRGIKAGVYHLIPAAPVRKGEARDWGNISRSMLDVIAYSGSENAMVWCDDRMINLHYRMGNHPIVGISEILDFLQTEQALSDREYFGALMHMRKSNVRYLPLSVEEIIYHLRRASVENGQLKETSELAALRRYLNTCMLDKERLQPPVIKSEGESQVREFSFPLGIRQSVDDALLEVWKNSEDKNDISAARGDWLLKNLHVDLNGFQQALIRNTSDREMRESIGYCIGAFFSRGIALGCPSRKSLNNRDRERYFNWIKTRLLEPFIELDELILPLVGQAISKFAAEGVTGQEHEGKPEEKRVMRILFAHFLNDLPVELQAELDLSVDVQSELGFKILGPSVGIEGMHFEPQLYWQAMVEAVNGRLGEVEERESQQKLQIRFDRCDDQRMIVKLSSEQWEGEKEYGGVSLNILLENFDARIDFLNSHDHWFDCWKTDSEKEKNALASLELPAERIEKLWDWRDNSPESTYRKIEREVVASARRFSMNDLKLPSWDRLLSHLRLRALGDEGSKSLIDQASETLLADEGLFVALHRMIYLPIRIPDVLELQWCALSQVDAENLFARLRSSSPSLISDLHCVRLAGLRNTPKFWEEAIQLQETLLSPTVGREDFACFHALLNYMNVEFGRSSLKKDCNAVSRLTCVWYHASRVHGSLRQIGNGSVRMVDWLERQMDFRVDDILTGEPDCWLDVAHPRNVTFSRLVVRGLANISGGLEGAKESLGERNDINSVLGGSDPKIASDRLGLLRRADLFSDSINCFFAEVMGENLEALFGESALSNYFGIVSDEQIESAITQLAEEPEHEVSWSILCGTIGDGHFPGELSASFLDIIDSINFLVLARESVATLSMSLIFSCQQAAKSGDTKLIERLKNTIFEIARAATSPSDLETNKEVLDFPLLDALLRLSIVSNNDEQSSERFFDYFREFLQEFPELLERHEFTTMTWLTKLPLSMQVNVWPFILTARALR